MPIQILPARLANQIAAGEVVERPASVIKELVENSLDAGATRIEVEVDKGGHKRILVRDNGSGIVQQELELALSRHATSKIASLDDLEAIMSLGFRGEALASISSVSRLSLTSRPQAQEQAWQAACEGRDMAVKLMPVAHPQGTSVEVLDLFFNTPARRKFLRTEKTEFNHIDEVIKRIALSRFDVAFSLKHNGKLLRNFPVADNDKARLKRVGQVCGGNFGNDAMLVQSEFQGLKLWGWVLPSAVGMADQQYCYVNGRMMRDKLVNHAIRQAFEGWLPPEGHAAYVLYLELDARQVDVNVHPAKHEVRFHQARMVHDFIYRAITDVLERPLNEADSENTPPQVHSLPAVEPKHDYITPLRPKVGEATSGYRTSRDVSSAAASAYQSLMRPAAPVTSAQTQTVDQWILVKAKWLLLMLENDCCLLPLYKLEQYKMLQQFSTRPVSQPLLMPIAIAGDDRLLSLAREKREECRALGLDIATLPNKVLLKQVPAGFRQTDWASLLPRVLESAEGQSKYCLVQGLAANDKEYQQAQAQALLSWSQQHFGSQWQRQLAAWSKALPLEQWLDE
ncbi:DNA mismatch repair endonuclease MutL [Aliiglaciecola sp. CAU 1673]|uniref:DNA mismatch repair endonuclease MutL n=1 Tax=Aliiglaciecola sp. CAU 1673 TaxID=3032595 RepID=UPI0023DBC0C3|nr:DNA mismatch repair endonuclease MutL [Aliiglaciecola sp. CAU 1673]MDF2180401.1 DNA mismatch repair endonuclease MutL [Aliiglaciecola sp. CAU 1673]